VRNATAAASSSSSPSSPAFQPEAKLVDKSASFSSSSGDARLKALIQWAAASEAGLEMNYYPFDDEYLAEALAPIT
jgi:hypothetical protein